MKLEECEFKPGDRVRLIKNKEVIGTVINYHRTSERNRFDISIKNLDTGRIGFVKDKDLELIIDSVILEKTEPPEDWGF